MTQHATHCYVTYLSRRVIEYIPQPVTPGSRTEHNLADNAPAGCELVDITGLSDVQGPYLPIDPHASGRAIPAKTCRYSITYRRAV